MVEPKPAMPLSWLVDVLRQQQATGFADFAGAHASATVPVSDRLATRLIADHLPPSAPVRDVDLRASDGNVVTVALRLAKPAILPRFEIPIHIEQQPRLPEQPVFVFRVALPLGLSAIAGPALRVFELLPPGVRLQEGRLTVDLRALLQHYHVAEALDFVDRLELTTVDGAILVRIDARVMPVS
jgi:hypothetical protein